MGQRAHVAALVAEKPSDLHFMPNRLNEACECMHLECEKMLQKIDVSRFIVVARFRVHVQVKEGDSVYNRGIGLDKGVRFEYANQGATILCNACLSSEGFSPYTLRIVFRYAK